MKISTVHLTNKMSFVSRRFLPFPFLFIVLATFFVKIALDKYWFEIVLQAEAQGAFVWDDPEQDQWSRIMVCTPKEPMNPFPECIHWFLWYLLIRVISDPDHLKGTHSLFLLLRLHESIKIFVEHALHVATFGGSCPQRRRIQFRTQA